MTVEPCVMCHCCYVKLVAVASFTAGCHGQATWPHVSFVVGPCSRAAATIWKASTSLPVPNATRRLPSEPDHEGTVPTSTFVRAACTLIGGSSRGIRGPSGKIGAVLMPHKGKASWLQNLTMRQPFVSILRRRRLCLVGTGLLFSSYSGHLLKAVSDHTFAKEDTRLGAGHGPVK